jgi:hypothetical protein
VIAKSRIEVLNRAEERPYTAKDSMRAKPLDFLIYPGLHTVPASEFIKCSAQVIKRKLHNNIHSVK